MIYFYFENQRLKQDWTHLGLSFGWKQMKAPLTSLKFVQSKKDRASSEIKEYRDRPVDVSVSVKEYSITPDHRIIYDEFQGIVWLSFSQPDLEYAIEIFDQLINTSGSRPVFFLPKGY